MSLLQEGWTLSTELFRTCQRREKGRPERQEKFNTHKEEALVTSHVLGVSKPAQHWIVDSGATCHICNANELFDDFNYVEKPQQVTLGDDRKLEVIGTGVVRLKLNHDRKIN